MNTWILNFNKCIFTTLGTSLIFLGFSIASPSTINNEPMDKIENRLNHIKWEFILRNQGILIQRKKKINFF